MTNQITCKNSYNLTNFKVIPTIELIFKDGTSRVLSIGERVRGVRCKEGKPIKVKWHNCSGINVTKDLKKWIYEELYYAVDPVCFSNSLKILFKNINKDNNVKGRKYE